MDFFNAHFLEIWTPETMSLIGARVTIAALLAPVDLLQLYHQTYLPDPKEYAGIRKGTPKIAYKIWKQLFKHFGFRLFFKGFTIEIVRIVSNVWLSLHLNPNQWLGGGLKGYFVTQLMKTVALWPFSAIRNRHRTAEFIDLLESRMENPNQKPVSKSVSGLIYATWKEQDVSGFLSGLQAGLLSFSLQLASTITILTVVPDRFLSGTEKLFFSRLVATVLSYPLETVAKRIQAWDYASYDQCIDQIWTREGLFGVKKRPVDLFLGYNGLPYLPVPTRGFFSGLGLSVYSMTISFACEKRLTEFFRDMYYFARDFLFFN